MKLPKTFLTEKSLDTKIEVLKDPCKASVEVTLEEFRKDDMFILYGEMTYEEKEKLLENAFSKIVDDTFENRIKWEKDRRVYGYSAKATILNYNKNPITLPVVFTMSKNIGYLNLGDKMGPCRNTFHKKVRQLAVKYFKMDIRKLF